MVSQNYAGVTVDDVGAGHPVIIFPGGPARHPDYLNRLAGLDEHGYRLVLIHPRGVGAAPIPSNPQDHAASHQVADVEALRDHLGLATITLITHSAGANVALDYAAQYPHRLACLVLITPSARVVNLADTEEEFEAQLGPQKHQPWYQTARRALDRMEHEGMTPELRAASRPLLYASWTPEVQAHAGLDPMQSTPDARAHYYDDEPDPDVVRAGLARVDCPVSIITGALDPAPGPELAGRLAGLFPHATVRTVSDAAHFPWVTNPGAFREALLASLPG